MSHTVTPFCLKDAPALIERLLPVQKLSAEVFKERKAGASQTLVPLGSYWKGRKPLILNKACILGCLLPATDDPKGDLEIFEKLMAMDDESFVARWKRRPRPQEILQALPIARIRDYFAVEPDGVLPDSAPVAWLQPEYDAVRVTWRQGISELERRQLEAQLLPRVPYRKRAEDARRPEEVIDTVHDHIWSAVNEHLGTRAESLPELIEQLGIMRFGHRPRVGDTFCGSGQIPFEAARLGCDVYGSDISPIACMLTWGALFVIGGDDEYRRELDRKQKALVESVRDDLEALGVDVDGRGWRAKAHLYCLEVRCPQTGWLVPMLPSRVVSHGRRAVAELTPDAERQRYNIEIRSGVTAHELLAATHGTVRSEGRGQAPFLVHTVEGTEYRTKISTLRGDYRKPDGSTGNNLRLWELADIKPRPEDIFQERLYAIQWMRPKAATKKFDYEFRSVGDADLEREAVVERYVIDHLAEWQTKGWVPDMRIEPGMKTDEPIRTRGWTYWHQLFPPRHLLILGLINKHAYGGEALLLLSRVLDYTSKLCRWSTSKPGTSRPGEGGRTGGGSDNPANVFYNQALNTLLNYGCRASDPLLEMLRFDMPSRPLITRREIENVSADSSESKCDLFVTDPPYGDAVKYEEILEYFIAWLRKHPPPEFANWVWDSRRSSAISGEAESFRRGMVSAYRHMTGYLSDNGIQVVMFTHQSGSIWADMANIVWAADLQVTAAWYVVTETESALREGSYVKGTVLLVLRKRIGTSKTTRDDLAWEIQEEVEEQVNALAGLNQDAKGLYRDENVFEDADIQMAGYAAALRVLTRYAVIDGRDMTTEAMRPRAKGETTFVDTLISFAVDTANQCLVPEGLAKAHWDRLKPAERFYLKMLQLEARGAKTLDNYQNFAKAFKVREFKPLLASQKANDARLKGAVELGRSEMSEGSEFYESVLRAVLYAVMELTNNMDGDEVLAHLTLNIPNYYGDMTQRELAGELADYLAKRLEMLRPDEAGNARVLRELIKNQRLG